MKPKQIIILAVILVVLVLAVVIQKTRKPPELQTEEYSALNLSFDPASATKLVIQKGEKDKLVELTKEDSVWKVTNFHNAKADQEKIENFLKQIKGLKGEMRGKSKSLYSDFKIAGEEAYQITAQGKAGAALFHLYLGNKRPGGPSGFIRKEGSEAVYYTNTDLFGAMGFWGELEKDSPKPNYWVSLKPFDLKPEQVEKLETKRIKDGKETVASSVARDGKNWKFSRPEVPFPADSDKVNQFFSSASSWSASQVSDPKEKDFDFSKPIFQMNISLEGQKEMLVTAAKAADGQNVYLQVSTEPLVYEFGSYNFQNLDIDDSKFFISNPLMVEADRVDKLEIKTPEKNLSFTPKEKKWDSLTNYINNDLKNIAIKQLLFDPADVKKAQPAKYLVKITKGQVTTVLEAGDLVSGTEKNYAAKLTNNTQPFAIAESSFKAFFENLDRLSEPK